MNRWNGPAESAGLTGWLVYNPNLLQGRAASRTAPGGQPGHSSHPLAQWEGKLPTSPLGTVQNDLPFRYSSKS